MRVVLPQADIRTQLWKALLPVNAPVATDIDFNTLGRKFELYPGSIESAIAHAAAEAASRPSDKQKSKYPSPLFALSILNFFLVVIMKDLLAAGEYEIAKVSCGFILLIHASLPSLTFACFLSFS